jgi:hypothetical protein
MTRGRPKLTWTKRRRQVWTVLRELAKDDRSMTLGEMSRACGFHGREDLKRVLRSLKLMGMIL